MPKLGVNYKNRRNLITVGIIGMGRVGTHLLRCIKVFDTLQNIESWWEMPETKEAVDKLKNYFFTDSGNFVRECTKELVTLRCWALEGKSSL